MYNILFVIQRIKSNKMPQTFRYQFSAQFLMLFQMVCYVLLSVLPIKTIYLKDSDWLLRFNNQSTEGSCAATQWAKLNRPSERGLKPDLKNSARLFVAFCLICFSVWQVVSDKKGPLKNFEHISTNHYYYTLLVLDL